MHAQTKTKIHKNKTMKQHVRKIHNTDKYQLRSTNHAQNWQINKTLRFNEKKHNTTKPDIHVTENKRRGTHKINIKHWYNKIYKNERKSWNDWLNP